ncbi:MAG: hypothetical protein ABI833_19260 [Acidobacteriota bacterium]
MFLRNLRQEDLIECLEIQPSRMGTELVGRSEALRAWNELIRSRSFNCIVLEADLVAHGRRIVGFGASAFVSPAFASDELANPRPGLNSRIIASIVNGKPVVLSEAELRFANTAGDLDLVILYGSFENCLLSEDERSDGFTMMGASFLEQHLGYRISQMINEVVDDVEKYYNDRTHAWREISTYAEFWEVNPASTWDRRRALHLISRNYFSRNGVMIDLLFLRRTPVLELRDADQQLLAAALGGSTDEELACRLTQNLSTIKKRWASLFERTLERRPDLFPDVSTDSGPTRGKQKRHHLLAYVRAHPEELRPHEAASRAKE